MNIVQVKYQHPDASMPMFVPVLVVPNTSEEVADKNISTNSAKDLEWLKSAPAHDGIAVLCGGGPSISNHIDDIRRLKDKGAVLFGLNGAAKWLADLGYEVDIQTILDAKEETSTLVDYRANMHLFASQCHPMTVDAVNPVLFHLNNIDIEELLPEERVNRGGYALIGGGVSVGITSMILAYAMGFREIHLFGYDSCNADGSTHAYRQDMNQFIPIIDVEWGENTYSASMPMKIQAEAFPQFAKELQDVGCTLHVYGKGLLQAMWTEPPASEKQKYKRMWSIKNYRSVSPGEDSAHTFVNVAKPTGTVIDFGCGTGRGSKAIAEKTDCNLILIDFADNCRDEDVVHFPFIEWDLTKPIPAKSEYGYCTDVMEHIPPQDVDVVLENILGAADNVFFQISTIPDSMGALIGQELHLTVEPYSWWLEKLSKLGDVAWSHEDKIAALFYVKRKG